MESGSSIEKANMTKKMTKLYFLFHLVPCLCPYFLSLSFLSSSIPLLMFFPSLFPLNSIYLIILLFFSSVVSYTYFLYLLLTFFQLFLSFMFFIPFTFFPLGLIFPSTLIRSLVQFSCKTPLINNFA